MAEVSRSANWSVRTGAITRAAVSRRVASGFPLDDGVSGSFDCNAVFCRPGCLDGRDARRPPRGWSPPATPDIPHPALGARQWREKGCFLVGNPVRRARKTKPARDYSLTPPSPAFGGRSPSAGMIRFLSLLLRWRRRYVHLGHYPPHPTAPSPTS